MSNKSIKNELIRLYGKGCMFHRARIAQRIEDMGGIKTYKRFIKERKFTRKQLNKFSKNLTYHHLVHKSEGGPTTLDNGAVVSELAHQYLHSLPRGDEEVIDNMLREFKINALSIEIGDNLEIEPIKIEFDNFDTVEFEVNDITPEIKNKRDRYNRAKDKELAKKKMKEQLDDDYEL